MCIKPFTFKKTKRVKVITEHQGISVDLTVKEAADLVAYLAPASTPDCRFLDLLRTLRAFAEANGGKSDLEPARDRQDYAFRMEKVPTKPEAK
jgi:hypothetical protein